MKTFIELGACDFDNLDGLLDRGWRGFFVEPVYAESLARKIEGKPNGVVVPQAITSYDGTIEMDVVLMNGKPQWMKGISHVVTTELENQSSGLVNRNTREGERHRRSVPCMKMDTFIKTYGITEIDYLQIDIEGHELVVLSDYSWAVKPKLIKCEHQHVDDTLLVKLLEAQGYMCWTERYDVYGMLV